MIINSNSLNNQEKRGNCEMKRLLLFCSLSSIMRQGFPDSASNISVTPTAHDKSDIYNKYYYHYIL